MKAKYKHGSETGGKNRGQKRQYVTKKQRVQQQAMCFVSPRKSGGFDPL